MPLCPAPEAKLKPGSYSACGSATIVNAEQDLAPDMAGLHRRWAFTTLSSEISRYRAPHCAASASLTPAGKPRSPPGVRGNEPGIDAARQPRSCVQTTRSPTARSSISLPGSARLISAPRIPSGPRAPSITTGTSMLRRPQLLRTTALPGCVLAGGAASSALPRSAYRMDQGKMLWLTCPGRPARWDVRRFPGRGRSGKLPK